MIRASHELAAAIAALTIITLMGAASMACPVEQPPREPESTGGPQSVLHCPGDAQCPPNPECGPSLRVGPTGACTHPCRAPADCTSLVSGETCLGGLCGVVCDPDVPDGGCGDAGMNVDGFTSVCIGVDGPGRMPTFVCGFEPAQP